MTIRLLILYWIFYYPEMVKSAVFNYTTFYYPEIKCITTRLIDELKSFSNKTFNLIGGLRSKPLKYLDHRSAPSLTWLNFKHYLRSRNQNLDFDCFDVAAGHKS